MNEFCIKPMTAIMGQRRWGMGGLPPPRRKKIGQILGFAAVRRSNCLPQCFGRTSEHLRAKIAIRLEKVEKLFRVKLKFYFASLNSGKLCPQILLKHRGLATTQNPI